MRILNREGGGILGGFDRGSFSNAWYGYVLPIPPDVYITEKLCDHYFILHTSRIPHFFLHNFNKFSRHTLCDISLENPVTTS